MTKFNRAKKQTLDKWETILWSWVDKKQAWNLGHIPTCCGFYADAIGANESGYTDGSPVNCPSTDNEINRQIPLVLAVLIYVEQMEV